MKRKISRRIDDDDGYLEHVDTILGQPRVLTERFFNVKIQL